jgi:hypothetical protein
MKSLAILGMSALLLGLIFQCCPSAATETPPIQPPAEQPAAPATEPALKEPTAAPMGLDQNNPVPLGYTLTASDGAAVTVHGIHSRGEAAVQLVQGWNMFNSEPDPGNEYVIVSATVAFPGGGAQDTLRVSEYDFRVAVGTRIFDHAFLVMEGNELEAEMFPGGSVDGLLVFEVPQGSSDIALMYTVPFDRTYYFATQ